MTKQEFEKRIGAEISQKDYSIVEHVYTWHPSISEVEGNTYWPEWFRRACCIQRLPAVRTGRFTEYRRRRCYQESMELLRKQTAEAPELAVNRLTIRALHQRRCNARIFYIRRTTEWIRKRM